MLKHHIKMKDFKIFICIDNNMAIFLTLIVEDVFLHFCTDLAAEEGLLSGVAFGLFMDIFTTRQTQSISKEAQKNHTHFSNKLETHIHYLQCFQS